MASVPAESSLSRHAVVSVARPKKAPASRMSYATNPRYGQTGLDGGSAVLTASEGS